MSTFLQIITIGFTLISAFFLTGLVFLSPNKIVSEVTEGKLPYHVKKAKYLASQAVDARLGLLFLLLSSIIQAYRVMKPVILSDFEVSWIGGWLGAFITIIMFGLAVWLKIFLRKRMINSIKKNIEKETIFVWYDPTETRR